MDKTVLQKEYIDLALWKLANCKRTKKKNENGWESKALFVLHDKITECSAISILFNHQVSSVEFDSKKLVYFIWAIVRA